MRPLRFRTASGSSASARRAGITGRRGRHIVLALTLVSMSACWDEGDPVGPDPDRNAAYSTTQSLTLAQTLSGCNGAAPLRTIQATPSNYRSLIAGLIPGDRLLLAAGTYTQGLPLHGKTEVGRSENGGTSADQLTFTNGNSSAADLYVLVYRYSSTRTTYQLKVSY